MDENHPFQGHILVVDDDKAIRRLLGDFLSQHGFDVKIASNAAEARLLMAAHSFHVMILDVMMPGESGLTLLKTLRQSDDTPVLLLTACDTLVQKVDGLDHGADDYITKPFEPLELVARLKSIIRRLKKTGPKESEILEFGKFIFHPKTGNLTINGTVVSLTTTERLLLQILGQRPFEPLSRDYLAQKIGYRVSERTIDVQINRLRQKLKTLDESADVIHTVRHLGYALMM